MKGGEREAERSGEAVSSSAPVVFVGHRAA